MKLIQGKQIENNSIENIVIDLFIYANNHESRKKCVYEFISKSCKITNSIAFCYNKNQTENSLNVNYFVVENQVDIYNVLDKEFSKFDKKNVNIVVDYSCMTKIWYYSILLYISKRKLSLNSVNLFFIYTPSEYSKPQKPKHNSEIAPLAGNYIIPTNKPKALIVCLGYEQNKAEGIINHLDPKLCYVFYTNPSLDSRFVETIKNNNRNILENYKYITTYPFDDLLFLERELTSLYYYLKDDYNIVIAPLGPKPFTLTAMLLSIKYPQIDIWRVGSGSDINQYSRKPLGNEKFIITELLFSN